MKNFIISITFGLLISIPFLGQNDCSSFTIYSLPTIDCNSSVIDNGLTFELTTDATGGCYLENDHLHGQLEINLASLPGIEEMLILSDPDYGIGNHYLYSGSTLVDSGQTSAASDGGVVLTNPQGLIIDKLVIISPEYAFYFNAIFIDYNCDPGPCDAKIQIEAEQGDVYIDDPCYGAILTSPNGTCYRIRVNDAGSLITEEVRACWDLSIEPQKAGFWFSAKLILSRIAELLCEK